MESTERQPFDLLKNELFYVTFDILTPRPHFMILPREKANINRDFGEMKLAERQELMKAARCVMGMYNIPSGTLSFHRGSWFSKKSETFSAHICVNVEPYIDVFKNEKGKIPEWAWPKDDEGKTVKANTNPNSYPQDVTDYEKNQQAKYFCNIEKPKDVLPTVDEEGITQVMHPSHPKIGFVGKRNEIEPEISLRVIEKFAQDLGLTNLENEDEIYGGCHVCLYLRPVPPFEGWSPTGEGEEVLGYIVIDWRFFYQLCRDIWFSAFKKSNFACLT